MKETNHKKLCCSRIIIFFCAAQKSPLLFCAAHRNKQKYFDAFSLLWDDTKRSNCPGRVGFAKARYMKSFPLFFHMISHLIVSFVGASVIGHGLMLSLSITKWCDLLNSQSLVYNGDRQAPPDLSNLLPEGTDLDPDIWLTRHKSIPVFHVGKPTHHQTADLVDPKDTSRGIRRYLPDPTDLE
jgi:hypothetical protein